MNKSLYNIALRVSECIKHFFQIAKFAMRGEDLPHALLYMPAQNRQHTYHPRNFLQETVFLQ